MLVIVHNILAPYRVPLSNGLEQSLDGQLTVVLTRDTHRMPRRSVPWQDVSFQVEYKVLGRVVTPAARAAFTPNSCAGAFLKGKEIVLPGEMSIRQTISERHRSRTK
jgi:hypothetical protein